MDVNITIILLFSVTLSNTAALYVSGISTLDMLGLNVSIYKNILGTCCSMTVPAYVRYVPVVGRTTGQRIANA